MEGTIIPVITTICFLIGKTIKATPIDSRWIPLMCLVIGSILGIFGYFFVPELHTGNPLIAIAMGAASGLAATGVHQCGQQMKESD